MAYAKTNLNTYAHFGSGMPQSAQNLLAGWFRRCSSLSLALDGSASVKHWKWSISIPLKQTKQIALTDIGKYIITGHEQYDKEMKSMAEKETESTNVALQSADKSWDRN